VRPGPRDLLPPGPDFVTHLVGGDPDLLPGPAATVAAPAAAKPILFPCPAGNPSLPVDGAARTVECTCCKATAYLPNDLWRRLHPVRRINRWHVWVLEDSPVLRDFRKAVDARRETGNRTAPGAAACAAASRQRRRNPRSILVGSPAPSTIGAPRIAARVYTSPPQYHI
jgi:hypothetical protein